MFRLGSSAVKFSFFIVFSLAIHLLCLTLRIEFPVAPEIFRPSGIGYVSRSADSFLPRLKSTETINIGGEKSPVEKIPVVEKKEVVFVPHVLKSQERIIEKNDLPLFPPQKGISHKRSQQNLTEPEPVVFHNRQTGEVVDVVEEPVIEEELNQQVVNVPPAPLSEAVAQSSSAKTEFSEQNRLGDPAQSKASPRTGDIHKSPAFRAALPCYNENPPPVYPEIARRRGWAGTVKFEVQVLEDGRVGHLDIVASSGYRSLDRAARKSISRWIFTPATSYGVPVESRVVVPIDFVLDN